jgi:hypothetical protein
MGRLTAWSGVCLCLLLLWQLQAHAIDDIQISIGSWSGDELAAQGFDLELKLTETGLMLRAEARELTLPAPLDKLNNVILRCEETLFASGRIQCQAGTLHFEHAQLGKQAISFSLALQPQLQQHQIKLSGLQLADSPVSLAITMNQSQWQLQVHADTVSLAALTTWLPLWLEPAQLTAIADWDYQGKVALDADIRGQDKAISQLTVKFAATDFSFSDQQDRYVGEGLTANGSLQVDMSASQWQWQNQLNVEAGQTYAEPIFIDFADTPAEIETAGSWQLPQQLIQVSQLRFEQKSVVSAHGQMTLEQNQLARLKVKTQPADLAKLYPIWLQPFMLDTAAAKLDTSGQVTVDFELDHDLYRLAVIADAVAVNDQEERFSVEGLSGKLGWSNADVVMDTGLSWQQAQVYAIPLGAAELKAQSHAGGFELLDSLILPVLDGELQLHAFSLQQDEQNQVSWSFEGLLSPISMETLSEALEWPTLHGKLSGVIPRVSYQDEQLKVDGALQVKLFDGTTVIRDLRMTSPLGALPQLYANIDVNNLDLELLTRTFDFGRISGRLEGYVHNLRLSNWQPVQFDARLATPDKNPGKRRISQKAVDNLSRIGGGATGILSRSFLRFFKDFSYQRLGLACKLQNGICEMSGVEEAEQGYFIVKGGGGLPPWINVVGYTRRVDWTDLIERLKAVSDSPGPVIQ